MSERFASSAPQTAPDLTRQAEQLLTLAGLDAPAPVVEAAQSAPVVESSSRDSAVQQTDPRDVLIVADLERGLSYRKVARRHDVSHATVGRLALRVQSQVDAARKLLAGRAMGAAEAFARAADVAADKGDHRPARDLLLHIGAIDPLADTSGQRGPSVAIVIGTPDTPIRVNASKDEG